MFLNISAPTLNKYKFFGPDSSRFQGASWGQNIVNNDVCLDTTIPQTFQRISLYEHLVVVVYRTCETPSPNPSPTPKKEENREICSPPPRKNPIFAFPGYKYL